MTLRRTLSILAIALPAIHFPCSAEPTDLRTSGEGVPLHWGDTSTPIPYFIEFNGCDDISDGSDFAAIQSAFQTWENVATGSVKFQFRGLIRSDGIDPGASIVMWMQEDWPYDPSYVAKTRLSYDKRTGRILKVELMLNGRDYRWSTNGESGSLDVQNVATHEVGHFIGFRDVREAGRTMFEYIAPGETEKCYLSDEDLRGVRTVYPLLAENEEVSLRAYALSYDGRTLRPVDRYPVPLERGDYLALFSLGNAGPSRRFVGIMKADDGGCALTVLDGDGNAVSRNEIRLGEGSNAGRVRAVSSLDLTGDGACEELAAVVSTPDGMSVFLADLSAYLPERGEIPMAPFPLRNADDLVAFAPLRSSEGAIGNVVVTAEKRRNSDFSVSLNRAVRIGQRGREVGLEPLRSWTVPDCTSLLGITAFARAAGESGIALLLRNETGELELATYSPPFTAFPTDGEPAEPDRRVDASVIERDGRPLAVSASEGRGIAVIVAR